VTFANYLTGKVFKPVSDTHELSVLAVVKIKYRKQMCCVKEDVALLGVLEEVTSEQDSQAGGDFWSQTVLH
jgi:hypothetical protein